MVLAGEAFLPCRYAGAEAYEEYEGGGGMLRRQGDGAGQDQCADCYRRTVRVSERGKSTMNDSPPAGQ